MKIKDNLELSGYLAPAGVTQSELTALAGHTIPEGTLVYNKESGENKWYYHNGTGFVPIDTTGGGSSVTVLDEDDFASDSATGVPSQQSAKAFVANNSHRDVAVTGSINVTTIAPDIDSVILHVRMAANASINFGSEGYYIWDSSKSEYTTTANTSGVFTNTFSNTLLISLFKSGSSWYIKYDSLPNDILKNRVVTPLPTTNYNNRSARSPIRIPFRDSLKTSDWFTYDATTDSITCNRSCTAEFIVDIRMLTNITNSGSIGLLVYSPFILGSLTNTSDGYGTLTVQRDGTGLRRGALRMSHVRDWTKGEVTFFSSLGSTSGSSTDPVVLAPRTELTIKTLHNIES